MNKRTNLTILAIILATCTACQCLSASNEPLKANPTLPASIQDPVLQQAWLVLYNHQEPINLWEGKSTSGRALAQFVLDHAIPIVWDTENVCGGASCSRKHDTEAGLMYIDAEPIYLLPSKQDDFQRLVAGMAHEIFHRTQPFGPVSCTRYEEYWAYWVGVTVAGSDWPKFEGVDPLVPSQLVQWFKDNHINGYYSLQYYPPAFSSLAQTTQQAANLVETLTRP